MDRSGFIFEGDFYGIPEKFDLDDGILIEQLTGYDLQTFLEELDVLDPTRPKLTILGCLLACSIRQAHPAWPKSKILRLVGGNSFAGLEFVAPDLEEAPAGDDASPPSEPTSPDSTEPPSSDSPLSEPNPDAAIPQSPPPLTESDTTESDSSERSLRSVTGSQA